MNTPDPVTQAAFGALFRQLPAAAQAQLKAELENKFGAAACKSLTCGCDDPANCTGSCSVPRVDIRMDRSQQSRLERGCDMPPAFQLPACYNVLCDKIDPCLYQFLINARTRFDEWSWLELNKTENEIVHFDQSRGINPGFNPVLPIAANQAMIFEQEARQVLPWQPGVIKISAVAWNGTPNLPEVSIIFYAGPKGVTGISGTPEAAGLILVGRPMKLSDFECGTDCYLLRFPRIYGCESSAIPDTRSLYVEVRAGAIGAATVTGINPTVIKRHTDQCGSLCKNYGWGFSGCS